MEMDKIQMQVNDKVIYLEGDYVGSLFRVSEKNINEHPLLTEHERESIKKELKSNKNILLG
jgi:hypothetical protein